MLSSTFGSPTPMPNNTYCPTLECRINDFTSLAVCPTCESEIVSFDKKNSNCSYGVRKGFRYKVNNNTYPAGLKPYFDENDSNPDNSSNNDTILTRGPLSTYSDFRKVATQAKEGSVWRKICSMGFENHPPFHLLFGVAPVRWLPASKALELKASTNVTESVSQLPWMRQMGIDYTSTRIQKIIGARSAPWQSGNDERPGGSPPKTVPSACLLDTWVKPVDASVNIVKSTCITTSSNPETIADLDTFGEMNATLTKCRLNICARRYRNVTMGANGIKVAHTTDSPLSVSIANGTEVYAKDENNNKFRFDLDQLRNLRSLLYDVTDTQSFKFLLDKNNPKSSADWVRFFERIAEVYTQTIQSPYNPDARRVEAQAYGLEVFVRVRWAWFIMPLLIVLASNVLLGLTMYQSRKKPYLYKNSILSTLFHGLEGWETHELLPAKVCGSETYNDMLDTSKGMLASLKKNDDGYLKLKRD